MVADSIHKLKNGYYSVVIDGIEYNTTANVISEFRLFAGKNIDDDTLEAFNERSQTLIAREKAIQMISRRMMSEQELVRKLAEKGIQITTAQECAVWLKDNGFIDDSRYAEAVSRHYLSKGYGAGKIRSELISRGIDRDISQDILNTLDVQDDTLLRFLQSRLNENSDKKDIEKAMASLSRRGFSWEQIRRAVESLNFTLD